MDPPQVYMCFPSWTLLPPHTIPLGRPSAPAPSIQYRASNLDWQLISYMILYMFQCHWCFLRPTWLHIPGCLALGEWSHHCDYLGHEGLFLHSSSVYSCHLFLISSASLRSIPFLSFIKLNFAWNVPLVSLIFLKRSLVFPILLFSSIYLHWSLRKALVSLLAILWNSAFRWVYHSFSPLPFVSLLFTAIRKASSDSHFAFLHFFFLWMILITVSCMMPPEGMYHDIVSPHVTDPLLTSSSTLKL